MSHFLSLVMRSAWNRRLTLGLVLVAITFSATMLLGVERTRHAAREGFTQSISQTDLVVGARTSAVQLMLYSIFHVGEANNNIRWSSFETISAMPAVAWAIPLSLGDSHRGFAVLGTTPAYFEHYRYGPAQNIRFAQGRAFAGIFDTVIGSEVAARLNYRLGSRIILSHGQGQGDTAALAKHADKPFTVTGILAPTGTPVDRTVHVSLGAIEAIHLDWQAGARLPGFAIPADKVAKFDLAPKEITAILVGLKHRAGVFRVQRAINEGEQEALMAVLPGVALDQLWRVMGTLEQTLLAVSAMVLLTSLIGLTAVILAGLNERRREIAILRSVGAGPRTIFLLLSTESLLVMLAGVVLGVALLDLATVFAGPVLQARYGLAFGQELITGTELRLLGLMVAVGMIASILPGWRAYRLSLADGLSPRL